MKFPKRANKKSLGLLAAVGLLIAGGAAYTVSISNNTDGFGNVAGYGSVATSGATLVSLAYVTNAPANPPWVETVTFTVNIGTDVGTTGPAGTDVPNASVGFNDDSSVGTPPTDVALTACTSTGAPVADTADPADFDASYTCDVSVLDPASPTGAPGNNIATTTGGMPVSLISSTDIAVEDTTFTS